MPRIEEIDLHPWGWETDPEEERFRLSTLDYLTTKTFTNMAVMFKVEASQKDMVTELFKESIARTLSQIRHMIGTIEKDPDGQHSIVRKRGTTTKFVVQYLDGPEDTYPSLAEMEKAHFTSDILGDADELSYLPMTFGPKPEADPDNSPPVSAFKLNYIPGGMILMLPSHHYANGIIAFTSFVHQMADWCYALANKTEHPAFDPRNLDRTLFTNLGFETAEASAGPNTETSGLAPAPAPALPVSSPPRHRRSHSLLFHVPKSKAAQLKKLATPADGSWITTYNAICAMMWRVFSRIREPLYNPGRDYTPTFGTGVTLIKRIPNMPERMQGNMQFDINSTTSHLPQFTLGEIISNVPLSKLASYIREMTESVTPEMLAVELQKVARMRDKKNLSISVDAFPLMALYITDWRGCNLCDFDFGFAHPTAYRHMFGIIPQGHCVVYPAHHGPAGDDEGIELQVTFEEELMADLLNDPEWNRYFEFRGVDMMEEGGTKPKL
ncbi:uncharacterized protein F5Z01DRAFT_481830 [Emericellopsis atlantica]|uniref:Uncharacterized protein n=1 Tax=Emericellopsis atlantica TaxID=2614577 RepID=A0A9P7ZS39_9HYPO|nr:uncharacterized protein F5Z01DRAFT_481830 [Emericellopsis atlantica]KAG9256670.1 hypothetical protein F5Z01DRAFT_481830 [Emericellopsis atlantica]